MNYFEYKQHILASFEKVQTNVEVNSIKEKMLNALSETERAEQLNSQHAEKHLKTVKKFEQGYAWAIRTDDIWIVVNYNGSDVTQLYVNENAEWTEEKLNALENGYQRATVMNVIANGIHFTWRDKYDPIDCMPLLQRFWKVQNLPPFGEVEGIVSLEALLNWKHFFNGLNKEMKLKMLKFIQGDENIKDVENFEDWYTWATDQQGKPIIIDIEGNEVTKDYIQSKSWTEERLATLKPEQREVVKKIVSN